MGSTVRIIAFSNSNLVLKTTIHWSLTVWRLFLPSAPIAAVAVASCFKLKTAE